MANRSRRFAMAGIALSFVVVLCAVIFWRGQRPGSPKHLKLAVVTWVGFGPFYIAKDKGYFAAEGLDVDLKRIDDFGARRAALSSGDLDGSVETVDSLAIGLAQGLPAVQVLIVDMSNGGDGIVVRDSIHSLEDLKGKTIACPKGTPSHFFLLYLLGKAGMSSSDFELKPMEAGDAGAAFVAGKVDAAVTWEPWLSKAKESPNGRVLTTTREHPGVIADTFVVTPSLAAKDPAAVKGILRAWFKAIAFLIDHPDESIGIMAKHLELPPEELKGMLEGVRFPNREENLAFIGVGATDNRFKMMFDAAVDLWVKEGLIKPGTAPKAQAAYDATFLEHVER